VVVFWDKLIAQIASKTAASLIGNAAVFRVATPFPLFFQEKKRAPFRGLWRIDSLLSRVWFFDAFSQFFS
jgi:hypothetical protein